jgi:hypothetical protein
MESFFRKATMGVSYIRTPLHKLLHSSRARLLFLNTNQAKFIQNFAHNNNSYDERQISSMGQLLTKKATGHLSRYSAVCAVTTISCHNYN